MAVNHDFNVEDVIDLHAHYCFLAWKADEKKEDAAAQYYGGVCVGIEKVLSSMGLQDLVDQLKYNRDCNGVNYGAA